MSANAHDTTMITNMKERMLIKLTNRYSSAQMKILKTCTLLDVRYKCEKYLARDLNELEADVKHILEDQQEQSQPQRDVGTREGMEPLNLSIVNNNSSNHVVPMFDFDDDDSIDESQVVEIDNLKTEIMCYKKIKMSKEEKEKCNVLQWWKHKKT